MNVLELMIKAVKGTVEEGVNQVLGGLGLVQEMEAPPVTRPPTTTPPPPASSTSEPKVASFEVVDAVFPDSTSSEDRGMAKGGDAKAGSPAGAKAGEVKVFGHGCGKNFRSRLIVEKRLEIPPGVLHVLALVASENDQPEGGGHGRG